MKQIHWHHFLGYRIILALLVRSYEYPDEYWQGPEIAHRIHYGYGFQTWEWTIDDPIRNPVYPFLLSLGYYILGFNQYMIQLSPHMMQALFAATSDFFMAKILLYYYSQIDLSNIFFIYTNWSYLTMLSRTYINSFETCLIVISFYFWVSRHRLRSFIDPDLISRIVAIIAYVSRPTSVMLWSIVWPYQLLSQFVNRENSVKMQLNKSCRFICKNILTMQVICEFRVIMIVVSLTVGSFYYGKLILTQANFIKYNFIEKWSVFYGNQPWYFYLVFTIPFLLAGNLINFLCSLYYLLKSKHQINQANTNAINLSNGHVNNLTSAKVSELRQLLLFIGIYLLISCTSQHKQHRFILPILPFLLIVSNYSSQCCEFKKFNKIVTMFGIVLNFLIFFGMGIVSKTEGIEVLREIRSQIPANQANQFHVAYFSDPHFIPALSILQRNVRFSIPDSSPPKKIKNQSQDELLMTDPHQLFDILSRNKTDIPHFVVLQTKKSSVSLQDYGYHFINEYVYQNVFEALWSFDSIMLYKRISVNDNKLSTKDPTEQKLATFKNDQNNQQL